VQELLQGPEIEQELKFEQCPELQPKSELQEGLELEQSLEQQGHGSSLEPELQKSADFEMKPEHQCGMEKLLVPEFQQGPGNKLKLEVQHDPERKLEVQQGPELELHQGSELQQSLGPEQSVEQQGSGSDLLKLEIRKDAVLVLKLELQQGMENRLLEPEFHKVLSHKLKSELQHDPKPQLEIIKQGPEFEQKSEFQPSSELEEKSEHQMSPELEQSQQLQGSGPNLEPEVQKGADLELKPELQQGLENKLEPGFQQDQGHSPKPKLARLSTFQQEMSSLKTTDLEIFPTAVLHEACTSFSSQSQPQPTGIAAPALDDSVDAGSDQIGKFLALRCTIVRQYHSYFVMWFSYRTKFILNRSVADPDPGSGIGCFLTPGSGIRDPE
jgi:hypothetical protein